MSGEPTSVLPDAWLRLHAGVPEKIDLGIERCKAVLEKLDLESPPYQIISVAGTNGKGSTLAFLDAILSESGYLTGRYTSPHLQNFNERIQLAQQPVENKIIVQAFNVIRSAADGIALSYFEYATIAALLIYAEQHIDVALLEVGLGGRLDAVNAVDADVAVISSIALDHQEWLGNDLNSIAREKAGIMRSNKPCILAEAHMPESLFEEAQKSGAIVIQAKKDFDFELGAHADSSSTHWVWQDKNYTFSLPFPALTGDIQIQNASAAIAALRYSSLWPIDKKVIANGLKRAALPGRLQQLKFAQRNWLLDVAHNPAAMQVLVESLGQTLQQQKSHSAVFAMLADKEVQECVDLLKASITDWFVCEVDSPRALQARTLQEILTDSGISSRNIHITDTVADACQMAVQQTQPDESILVCGSFYTVGAALDYFAE